MQSLCRAGGQVECWLCAGQGIEQRHHRLTGIAPGALLQGPRGAGCCRRLVIQAQLQRRAGDVGEAAALSGLSRSRLYALLKKHDLIAAFRPS